MRVCGVICEYNPFHKGHALHLARARALSGADYMVCAMSGSVVQRGEFARHDKWTRAHAALKGGADLVVELPVRFACQSATDFARGGIQLLSALGVVTHLSFGCEREALPLLFPLADLLGKEPLAMKAALRRALDDGASYPRALTLALEAVCPQLTEIALPTLPNAMLALAYLRALPPQIAPVPIERVGGGYHERELTEFAGATAVREALERGELFAALSCLPFPQLFAEAEAREDVHTPQALDLPLLLRLREATPETLSGICGMDEGLEHRLIAAARTATSRQSLLEGVKTRRYTRARLSRLCTLALLDVTRALCDAYPAPSYVRILGFRREASPLLHEIKARSTLPLVTKAADADPHDGLFALDVRAQDLWSLGCKSESLRVCGRDMTTSPVIL